MNGGLRRPLFGIGLAVMGLALAVAGCGGGPPEAGVASVRTTTTSTASTASSAPAGVASGSSATGGSAPGGALVEYARCMRAHGVSSFPEPGSLAAPGAIRAFKGEVVQSVGSLGSSPVFQAAQRACARYYGPPPTRAPAVSAEEMQKLLAVSRCMRAHGVSAFPDPDPITGAVDPPASIVRNSPVVIAALRACAALGRAAGLGPPTTGQ